MGPIPPKLEADFRRLGGGFPWRLSTLSCIRRDIKIMCGVCALLEYLNPVVNMPFAYETRKFESKLVLTHPVTLADH
eukprot:1395074-Amorphochlora_amoeboformis.AAC.2